jgi:hypothetical protein
MFAWKTAGQPRFSPLIVVEENFSCMVRLVQLTVPNSRSSRSAAQRTRICRLAPFCVAPMARPIRIASSNPVITKLSHLRLCLLMLCY